MGGIVVEREKEKMDTCSYCGEKNGKRSECPACDFFRKNASLDKSIKKMNGNEFITIPG